MTTETRIEKLASGVAALHARWDRIAKFNPCHNQSDGKFCSTTGGGASGGGDTFEDVDESEMRAYVEQAWQKYTAKEQSTIGGYTSHNYIEINKYLRGQYGERGANMFADVKARADARIAKLDTAMAKWEAPRDLVAYRGCRNCFANAKVGDIVVDSGFVSASVGKAKDFAFTRHAESKVTMLVPKGTNAIPVGHKSKRLSENEVIFPRGSKFQVTATTSDGGVTVKLIK